MLKLLSDQVKLVKVADYASANTTDVTGTGVDLSADGGWDGVLFLTSYGTAAANNVMHAECSSDNADADAYADIATSEVDAGASDEDQWIDVFQPPEKWVRPVAARGTSSTLENIWAILYRGRNLPFSNVTSGTINGKQVVQQAEGTK